MVLKGEGRWRGASGEGRVARGEGRGGLWCLVFYSVVSCLLFCGVLSSILGSIAPSLLGWRPSKPNAPNPPNPPNPPDPPNPPKPNSNESPDPLSLGWSQFASQSIYLFLTVHVLSSGVVRKPPHAPVRAHRAWL